MDAYDPDLKAPISRRGFLRTSALGAGAAVSLAGCGSREEKLIPLLIPEESFIPGTDRWTPGTCMLCAAGCGTLVRTMQGEAKVQREGHEHRQMIVQVKKVEGNPAHPINLGRLCALGQAAPQDLYHPDRIRTPLKGKGARGSGEFEAISWNEALALLESKLKPLITGGPASGLAAIAGGASQARLELLADFLSAAGSERIWIEDPPGVPTLREANRRIYGRNALDIHDLENSRYLLCFGADFLEAHSSPVRYSLGLAHLRGGREGRRAKLVQVEARFSLTAAQADEWLPVQPGNEGMLALAIAHVILKEQLFDQEAVRAQTHGFEDYRTRVLENYSPAKIAAQVGIPEEKIIRIAREFAQHQPGFAFAGGTALAHKHGLFTAAAIQSLNAVVGNLGRQGGVSWTASSLPISAPRPALAGHGIDGLPAVVDSVKMLLVWNADPVYGTPAALRVTQALEKIPFIAAFSTLIDDTSAFADLILPDRTSLERWDVVQPEMTRGSRILSICQPVVRPLYEAQDCGDILLGIASRMGGKVREALPDGTWKDYLKRRIKDANVLNHGSFSSEDLDSYWEKLLEEGVWVDSAQAGPAPKADLSAVVQLEPPSSPEPDKQEFPFHLQPYTPGSMGFGRSAHLPWMQEMPDPMTSAAWGSWVEINPRTAAKLNIREGELIWLESEHGRIRAPAVFTPAARPDTVHIPFGQGHRFYGRYASGRGVNPWEVIAPTRVRDTEDWAWADTRVRIRGTGEKGRVIKIG